MSNEQTPMENRIEELQSYIIKLKLENTQQKGNLLNYAVNICPDLDSQIEQLKAENEKLKVEIAEHELYHKTVDEQVLEKNDAIDELMAENKKLKEALGRIYTMDITVDTYPKVIMDLIKIAGEAIK